MPIKISVIEMKSDILLELAEYEAEETRLRKAAEKQKEMALLVSMYKGNLYEASRTVLAGDRVSAGRPRREEPVNGGTVKTKSGKTRALDGGDELRAAREEAAGYALYDAAEAFNAVEAFKKDPDIREAQRTLRIALDRCNRMIQSDAPPATWPGNAKPDADSLVQLIEQHSKRYDPGVAAGNAPTEEHRHDS